MPPCYRCVGSEWLCKRNKYRCCRVDVEVGLFPVSLQVAVRPAESEWFQDAVEHSLSYVGLAQPNLV